MAATDSIANMNTTPMAAATADTVRLVMNVVIGAAGAVSTTLGDRGCSAALNGAGTYDLTFPKVPDSGQATSRTQVHITMQSPALTIASVVLTATDPAAGTATLKTLNAAGAAAAPASGDVISVQIFASRSKAVL
jgi:hypothetical protein